MIPVSTAGQARLGSGETALIFPISLPEDPGDSTAPWHSTASPELPQPQEVTLTCAGSRVQEDFQKQTLAPCRSSGSQQAVEGSRRLNLHLGICTLPSLLPQTSSFFQILSMF